MELASGHATSAMVCAAIPVPSLPSLTACLSLAGGPGRYRPKAKREKEECARVPGPVAVPVETRPTVSVKRVGVPDMACDVLEVVAWDPNAVEVEAVTVLN